MAEKDHILDSERLERLSKALFESRKEFEEFDFWPWLSEFKGKPATKKAANKFIFAAIIDYQMDADIIWKKARWLTEKQWHDPDDLWQKVASYSHHEWMGLWREYGLHRFPHAHERIWRIGGEILEKYGGDARNIWTEKGPIEVLHDLMELRMGPQISRMIVGALLDTKQISGDTEMKHTCPKADLNLCRVLGRSVFGVDEIDSKEVTSITKRLNPEYPWELDLPLFSIGRSYCTKSKPKCDECPLSNCCSYNM